MLRYLTTAVLGKKEKELVKKAGYMDIKSKSIQVAGRDQVAFMKKAKGVGCSL